MTMPLPNGGAERPQHHHRIHLLGSNRELILGGSLGPGDSINARVVLSETIDAVEFIVRHVRESIVTQSVGWLGHLAVVTLNECWVKILRVKKNGNVVSK